MAIDLNTLTSPANSSVLEEVNTTADFLESCPVLRNLARGSQKGGDAKQDTALNQPRGLPLVNGEGYFYSSGVTGNYCEIPNDSSLAEMREVSVVFNAQTPDSSAARYLFARPSASSFQNSLVVEVSGGNRVSFYDQGGSRVVTTTITFGNVYTVKLTFNGTAVELFLDGVSVDTGTASTSNPFDISQNVLIGGGNTNRYLTGFVKSAVAKNASGTTVLNFDVNATTVRHNDTKFKCSTGQIVTINQSGLDPSTIIKKSVLRFNGVNTALGGLLNQTIDSGYFFAAFSVLGNGGEPSGRVFGINSTGGFDYNSTGFFVSGHNGNTNDIDSYYGNVGWRPQHDGMFDDSNGDILHELKFQAGAQRSRVNNADERNRTDTMDQISAEEFKIGALTLAGQDAVAIDLEYLALFPASITDAQADSVRNYINNRNNVFSLVDGFGYYFYDAQKAPVGNISSGSSSWNGRIVGSDNGDTDKYATQATANDQPVGDGYVVTFADNTDHLEIPSTTQAGWQIVGTSRGTFAYRVNATAETELNLLGYGAPYRQTGDLYGIILLPETATGADIEAARKLLIDRGAADAFTENSTLSHWRSRNDIVVFNNVGFSGVLQANSTWRFTVNMTEFKVQSMPDLTYAYRAWSECQALESFNTLLPAVTDASDAWYNCTSLSDFRTTDLKNCANFTSAWQGCSALQQFPSGAKLGTEASNVNFTSAWRSSGLTSFSTPLPTGADVRSAWRNNTSLTDFSTDVFNNWNPTSITSGVFNNTWVGNPALTAISVENILVSINNSGQYATSDGDAYVNGVNTQLADAGIDIDYNVATGSLSAATTAAITSLKSKGWSIIVNNVTL